MFTLYLHLFILYLYTLFIYLYTYIDSWHRSQTEYIRLIFILLKIMLLGLSIQFKKLMLSSILS